MDPVTGLSLGRIALGIGALAAPTRTAKAFGLKPEANAQLSYFARMFGAREVALGALTLAARGEARRRLVLVGLAVDGADAATGALGLRSKEFTPVSGGMLVAGALGAVGSGVAALVAGRE